MKKFFVLIITMLMAGNVYAAMPVITGVSPDFGPSDGGAVIIITGTGFTGTYMVYYGGVPGPVFTVDSDTQVTSTMPVTSPGMADVKLENASGQSNMWPFEILAPTETGTPTITGTITATWTATETATDTATPEDTGTPTATGTHTQTPEDTHTATLTMTETGTSTVTPTATDTYSATVTQTATGTRTVTRTYTATATVTVTCTITPTNTPFITPTIEPGLYEKLKGTLYPNPVKAGQPLRIIYEFSDFIYTVNVTIYTMDGRKARERSWSGLTGKGRLEMDTENLAPGIYFYRTLITAPNTLMVVGAEDVREEYLKRLVISK
jgi:hypothetical protein